MHIHDERALLALQGPMASAALQGMTKLDLSKFFFGAFAMVDLAGIPCFVTRTGYTGEDGFEISVPNERATELTQKLMGTGKVHLAGAPRRCCPLARMMLTRRSSALQAWARATACASRLACACTATT